MKIKDTLRKDMKDLMGTPRDNAQYMQLAFKQSAFSIIAGDRAYDVTLEGEVDAVDPSGQPIANFSASSAGTMNSLLYKVMEAYGSYLDAGRISEIHHDRLALWHVRESGKAFNYPVEVFDNLADVFLWVSQQE